MPPTRTSPEWQAEYDERLGLLCGDGVPTREQEALARRELARKSTIVAQGFYKRGKTEEYERYRRIAQEFGRES